MTGPYRAEVFFDVDPWRVSDDAEPDIELNWEENRDDLEAGSSLAWNYYSRGGGATMVGTLRAATLFIGAGLEPGERAYIRLLGREVAAGDDRAPAGDATIRRDEAGRVLSTLGSRNAAERVFRGI